MYVSTEYVSPVGVLTLAADGEKLIGLWLDGQKHFGAGLELIPGEVPVFDETRAWLDRYFAGESPEPEELPLEPKGTEFQKKVWTQLCAIPYGKTIAYGELAKCLQSSPRAVGSAVGRNPISIIIPCHRVLGAGGGLTGYAGGVNRKRWLLKHEGIL